MSAFPIYSLYQDRDDNYRLDVEGGLSARELITLVAMHGILSAGIPGQHNLPAAVAYDASLYADALLAEFAKERK